MAKAAGKGEVIKAVLGPCVKISWIGAHWPTFGLEIQSAPVTAKAETNFRAKGINKQAGFLPSRWTRRRRDGNLVLVWFPAPDGRIISLREETR
jgi:hypothetical protein